MSKLPALSPEILNQSGANHIESTRERKPSSKLIKPLCMRASVDLPGTKFDKIELFKPLDIVNGVNWHPSKIDLAGYPWKMVKKSCSSSTVNSLSGSAKSIPAYKFERKPIFQGEEKSTVADGLENHLIKSKSESIDKPESSYNILSEFDHQIARSRPKPISDKKLAVRSDVVNKTLLRSLKRYYTAKFEDETGYKNLTKEQQKSQINKLLEDFTISVYQNDKRFDLDEFSGINMEDLVFYMGICINPMYMKRKTTSSNQRMKFQNFYNCLYKYSHKKLLKLFQSKVLHFMFRKFFEEGPFDGLLVHDSTLQKNPDVYKKASLNFLELFKQNETDVL